MIKYLDLQAINASYGEELALAVGSVVKSGRYLNDKCLVRFEADFAQYIGARYCVGVANGLDALSLSLMAFKQLYGWENDDEVLVPALTFVATAQAVNRAGLRPVFCDVNEDDFLFSIEDARRRVTDRTRCVLPVHLYGRVCDMQSLQDFAKQYNIILLEDAAQAHGAVMNGIRAGNWGKAAAFSFYPGKNLGALGDGGAVVTNDEAVAECVRVLANYGSPKKYIHNYMGLNSRLDEVQAAVLSVKLKRLDADNERRRQLAAVYNLTIHTPQVQLPYAGSTDCSVFHIYPIMAKDRDGLCVFLREHGVETLIHYPLPLHLQKIYADLGQKGGLPVAERLANAELSLPLHPLLSEEEVYSIAQLVNTYYKNNKDL